MGIAEQALDLVHRHIRQTYASPNAQKAAWHSRQAQIWSRVYTRHG